MITVVLIGNASADEETSIGLNDFWLSQQSRPRDVESMQIAATVTYQDPISKFVFVQDKDCGSFLRITRAELLPVGTRVQIDASYTRSNGVLAFDLGSLTVLDGKNSSPIAKVVASHKLPRLRALKLMCRLVKTSASVVHVEGWDTHTVVTLDVGRGEMVKLMIPIELTPAVAEKVAKWVNQTIEFEAVVGMKESLRGEATGTNLFAASLNQITIEDPDRLFDDSGTTGEIGSVAEEKCRLSGVVTLITDDGLIVQGEGVGTFVTTRGPLMVSPGKLVDIIASEQGTTLNLHTLRLHADQHTKPLVVSSMRSLSRADSQLVKVAGTVESFEAVGDSVVVLLKDGHRRFSVSVPGTLSEFAEVAIHSALRIEAVGVCSLPDSLHFEAPEQWIDHDLNCSVRARSVDDIVVAIRRSTLPVSYVTWILIPLVSVAAVFLFNWNILRRNVGGIRAAADRNTSRVTSFFDCIPDAILVTSAKGDIRLMNPAAKDMFEHSMHIGDAEELLRTELHMLRQSFRETVQTAIRFGRAEVNLESSSPSQRHIHLVLVRTDNSPTVCDQLLWVLRDVTESVVLQEKMSAVQQSEVIGQLAGGLAHDFNNLLQCISGNLQVACILKAQQRTQLESCLSDASDATTAATELVRRLLRLNTSTEGVRQSVSVSEVLDDLRGMASGLLPEGITLSFIYPDTDIVFEGDRSVVEQALLNFCVNARDAIETEGVIRVSGELMQQEIGGQIQAAAVFCCEDSGCGMSPSILGQVFQPFFTTKEPGRGTGLGLACTHAAIQRMGGMIEVESRVGIGTEFRLIIGGARPATRIVDTSKRLQDSALTT